MRKVWKAKRKDAPGWNVQWYDDQGCRKTKYFAPRHKKFMNGFIAAKMVELNSDCYPPGHVISIPWESLYDQYIKQKTVEGLKKNSLYQIRRALTLFRESEKIYHSEQITQAAVNDYIMNRIKNLKPKTTKKESKKKDKSKWSPHTLNKHIRNLRTFLAWGKSKRFFQQDLKIKQIRAPAKTVRILSDAEVKRLIGACGNDAEWRMKILLLMGTGFRRGDLDNLDVRDIDIEHRAVSTRQEKTGKVTNYQPIPDALMPELIRYIQDHVPVGRQKLWRTKWNKKWYKIRDRAGLDDITPHDLRRTFGSMQADAGVPIKALQELYKHASIETTMKHYIATNEETKRKGVNTLEVEKWL